MESSRYVYSWSVTFFLGLDPSISKKIVDKKHPLAVFTEIQQHKHCCSLSGQCDRFAVKMSTYKMPFYGNIEYWLIENENQSILLSFNIIARQVLVSSQEIMTIIVILTRCHVVTSSYRFRAELQTVSKEPAKLVQIPSWISITRKVYFLNTKALELKI